MLECWEILGKILEPIAFLATIVAVVFGAIAVQTYTTSVNQFSFGVMKHCLDAYVQMLDKIKPEMQGSDLDHYLELVNQEFFYIQQDYIPLEVAIEWMDGIITLIPIFDSKQNILNPDTSIKALHDPESQYLSKKFPRLKKCLKLEDTRDFSAAFSTNQEHYNLAVRIDLIIVLLNKFKKLSNAKRKAIRSSGYWRV